MPNQQSNSGRATEERSVHNLFILMLLALLACGGSAQEPQGGNVVKKVPTSREVFELDIASSDVRSYNFKLYREENGGILLIGFNGNPPEADEAAHHLDRKALRNLERMLEKALRYNTLDDGMGLDGSTWCLSSARGFTTTKACFWTPNYGHKERGLTGLYELGAHLEALARQKILAGDCY